MFKVISAVHEFFSGVDMVTTHEESRKPSFKRQAMPCLAHGQGSECEFYRTGSTASIVG